MVLMAIIVLFILWARSFVHYDKKRRIVLEYHKPERWSEDFYDAQVKKMICKSLGIPKELMRQLKYEDMMRGHQLQMAFDYRYRYRKSAENVDSLLKLKD